MVKQILILEEGGKTCYFDVSTEDRLHSVCLSIVKVRNDRGAYASKLSCPKQPIVPNPGVRIKTRSVVRGHAITLWRKYNEEKRAYDTEQEQVVILQRVLGENSGQSAYEFLLGRKEKYGEDFRIAVVLDVLV